MDTRALTIICLAPKSQVIARSSPFSSVSSITDIIFVATDATGGRVDFSANNANYEKNYKNSYLMCSAVVIFTHIV